MSADSLDVRDGRNILSYVVGIGVEMLLTAALAAITAVTVAVCSLLVR